MQKVPYVKLKGEWKGNPSQTRYKKKHQMPRYEHPAYQAAFRESIVACARNHTWKRRGSPVERSWEPSPNEKADVSAYGADLQVCQNGPTAQIPARHRPLHQAMCAAGRTAHTT
jgi:hypothetical protein